MQEEGEAPGREKGQDSGKEVRQKVFFWSCCGHDKTLRVKKKISAAVEEM
jgi:hypothetical protein